MTAGGRRGDRHDLQRGAQAGLAVFVVTYAAVIWAR
jgi:hypothetical protein